jgi:hypothetical protein
MYQLAKYIRHEINFFDSDHMYCYDKSIMVRIAVSA